MGLGFERGDAVRASTPAADLGPLIGRQSELAEILQLIERQRLVSLLGVGGVGKTRLALAAAHVLRTRSPARTVTFVDLAAATDRSWMLREVAAALGAREMGAATDEDRVVDALETQQEPLLVLDNLEQLPDAGDVVAGLLARLPRIRILATSRLPVAPGIEAAIRVEPLALPVGTGLGEILEAPATALFIARARSIGRLQSIDADAATVVARLCRRLDGLPLALELAAARTWLLTAEAIDRRLAASAHALLVKPDDSGRHRSLDAVLDWTLNLLGEDDRRMLFSVSVCHGPFDLDMAADLCPGVNALDVMERLASAALVQYEPDPRGEPTLRLLETVRNSCIERLTASQLTAIRARHVMAMHALVLRERESVLGPARSSAVHRLRGQVDNLRAAFDAALTTQPAVAIALVAEIWRFWSAVGRGSEAIDRLRTALALETKPTAARALGLSALAGLLVNLHGWAAGGPAAREAIRIARRVGAPAIELDALPGGAFGAIGNGDGPAAVRLGRRAVALARRESDGRALIRALATLGIAEGLFGDEDAGRRALNASIAEARRQGDPLNEGIQLANLASFELDAGRAAQAILPASAATAVLRALDADDYLVSAEALLGAALAEHGQLEEARRVFAAAATRIRDLNMPLRWGELFCRAMPYLRRVGAIDTLAHVWAVLRRLENTGSVAMEPRQRANAELAITLSASAEPGLFAHALQSGVSSEPRAILQELIDVLHRERPRGAQRLEPSSFRLTRREAEILEALGDGLRDAELAARFGISAKTASVHVANIKAKLGLRTRLDAALAGRGLRDTLAVLESGEASVDPML